MNAEKGLMEKENFNLSLIDILYLIMQNRWVVGAVFIFCLLISGLFIYTEKPNYESRLLLQVDNPKNTFTQEIVSQLTSQASSADAASTQISLIKSRFILEPVIEKLGLNIHYNLPSSWRNQLFSSPVQPNMVKEFVVPTQYLSKKFKIIFNAKHYLKLYDFQNQLILQGKVGELLVDPSGLYKIHVHQKSYKPNYQFFIEKSSSLNVVDELLSQLKIQQMGERGTTSTGILELAIQGHDSTRIMSILNTIAKVAVDRDIRKKSQEAAKTLEFLYHQLPITQKQLQQSENELNAYRSKSGKIDIKIQTQFLLQKMVHLDTKLNQLRLRKMTLLSYYTTKHPKIINLQEQIQGIENQRQELEKTLKNLPASDQVALNLMREVSVKKMLYMKLLSKIQELEVIKAGTISSLHILTKASRPHAPLPSHAKVYILLALIIASAISTLIIIIKNILYFKIEDPYWVEKHYHIPNLAIIPYAKEQIEIKSSKNKCISLIAHEYPKSLAIETLRSLRTSIQVNLATSSNNIVTIMGISPGVGKSFISSNLAYLMSSAGKRVLIIDADLRKGTVHKYMKLHAAPGLTEVLENKVSIQQAIHHHVYPHLDVMTRGVYPINPSELLMKPEFGNVIKQLSLKYDLIILDTAPVLMVTDAVLIGGISSNNYLIIGAKSHQSIEIDLVVKRLNTAGIRLIGTVFNITKGENSQNLFGRYARYGQYYYSGYSNYYADEKVVE